MLQKESDDYEKADLDDLSQYKVVSHKPKSAIDIFCEKIRNDVVFSGFKKLHYEKLDKEDKVKIEEAMYDMMSTLKITLLEISGTIPRRLCTMIEQKESHCIVSYRWIREANLS